jgi:hypothetical protein
VKEEKAMTSINSYWTGIKRATAERKMMFLLWMVNLVFASAVYFLVSGYVGSALGNSEAAGSLLKSFDFGIFMEMIVQRGSPVLTILLVALILSITFFWISVFLNGGILFSLVKSGKASDMEDSRPRFISVFFQGTGKFFGRFFRLTLYALLFWFVAILAMLFLNAVTKPLMDQGLNEKAVFYLTVVKVIFGLFLFFLIRMVLDYARIAIVTEDSRFVFRALFQALGFVFKKLGSTLGLYYALLVTGLVLFIVFWFVDTIIPGDSNYFIVLAFLVGQIFIFSRGWFKIAFLASQIRLYTLKAG